MLLTKIKPQLAFQAVRIVVCGLLFVSTTNLAAAEKADVNLKYSITIAAVPIGAVTLSARFDDDKFNVIANGRTAGVSRLVSDGTGTFSTSGRLRGGKVVPTNFKMDTADDELVTKVRMNMASGSIKQLFAAPPLSKRPDRIPVKSQHWRNILDPLSAFMVPLDNDGRISPRDACNRTIPVFDGWQRFNVRLSFKEQRQASLGGSNGYKGPVVICKARYQPIAGHRPTRATTVYLQNRSKMELWLAPVPGVPVLVPVNIKIGTRFGPLTLGISAFDARVGRAAVAATK